MTSLVIVTVMCAMFAMFALGYVRADRRRRRQIEHIYGELHQLKVVNIELQHRLWVHSPKSVPSVRDPEPPTPDTPGPRHSLRWETYKRGK